MSSSCGGVADAHASSKKELEDIMLVVGSWYDAVPQHACTNEVRDAISELGHDAAVMYTKLDANTTEPEKRIIWKIRSKASQTNTTN